MNDRNIIGGLMAFLGAYMWLMAFNCAAVSVPYSVFSFNELALLIIKNQYPLLVLSLFLSLAGFAVMFGKNKAYVNDES